MSVYVLDVFCATSAFPAIRWNWKKDSPPVHISCFDMWDDNFVPRVYDICDLSLGSMYQKIFKAGTLAISERVRTLITFHGDWYVGEYFSYIRIWGRNTVNLLPRIVPYRMVLQEIAYHTVIDGVFPKLA